MNIWEKYGLSGKEYIAATEQLGRQPNDLELALLGVMWSEHCSYKHTRHLLKKLPVSGPIMVQGPGENAGVIDAGDGLGIAFKIESHNHPSAVEPYQGAATGVGGIVRDVFSMGARPVAILNSLRFGSLDSVRTRYLLRGVVSGIAGYGNCLGVPTVGGEIYFEECYKSNPLVNAMCIGVVPLDRLRKGTAAGPGNRVLVVGAKTGRDGIAGAAFASVELSEDIEADRPAVQVGDPFTEKLLMEACLELQSNEHIVGVQDLGAAGLTSASSEMAYRGGCGLEIELSRVPLREKGMSPTEIMLSESQERMLFVVRPDGVDEVRATLARWGLEAADVGVVTEGEEMVLKFGGECVGRIPPRALADGAPRRNPSQSRPDWFSRKDEDGHVHLRRTDDYSEALLNTLSSPNIASRRPVWRQYDHMVMTNTVQAPGSSAAVLRIRGGKKGIAATTDCNSRYCWLDPREGARRAVAEAARNVACTGARPSAVTNCLNMPNPEYPRNYWSLDQTIEGMAEACLALGTPVVGGNVSLYNESGATEIYPTPVIGMVGLLEDVSSACGIAVREGNILVLAGGIQPLLGGSQYLLDSIGRLTGPIPRVDLDKELGLCRFLPEAVEQGLLAAAHDVSDGGIAVTLSEMAIAGDCGFQIDLPSDVQPDHWLFAESPGAVVIALAKDDLPLLERLSERHDVPLTVLGRAEGRLLTARGAFSIPLDTARASWGTTLEKVLG